METITVTIKANSDYYVHSHCSYNYPNRKCLTKITREQQNNITSYTSLCIGNIFFSIKNNITDCFIDFNCFTNIILRNYNDFDVVISFTYGDETYKANNFIEEGYVGNRKFAYSNDNNTFAPDLYRFLFPSEPTLICKPNRNSFAPDLHRFLFPIK